MLGAISAAVARGRNVGQADMKQRSLLAMLTGLLTVLALLATAAGAAAQTAEDYPSRPVRIIVTQAAGSGMDIQARILAQRMSELWGQPWVVESRPGANGIIAMDAVAKAKADGYTLAYASVSVLTMNPFIYKSLPYNTLRDFAPITQTGVNPMGLVVSPALGVNSLGELIALAKAHPGALNFGSFGIGNQTHLMGEMLSEAAGIKITHVPYKGQTPAITDLMGGQVEMVFTTLAGVTEHVEAGRLRLLATFGEERDAAFPNVPTVRESGYPRVVIAGWSGLLAPAGVPQQVLHRLQNGVVQILALPEVKSAFARQGARAAPSSSDAFARLIQSEAQKFSVIIKAAGLQGTQ
jgi:tripartite-type tricarboxylate transporter receptor subunit TctC